MRKARTIVFLLPGNPGICSGISALSLCDPLILFTGTELS